MNSKINIFWIAIVSLFLSCHINRLNPEKTVITLDSQEAGQPVRITVSRGPEWTRTFKPGPFVIHMLPQMVFWMEDSLNNRTQTLYITGADGDYKDNSAKRNEQEHYFKQYFPVWASGMVASGPQHAEQHHVTSVDADAPLVDLAELYPLAEARPTREEVLLQAAIRLRPRRRRALRIRRPPRVRMRARKPWFFLRRRLLG